MALDLGGIPWKRLIEAQWFDLDLPDAPYIDTWVVNYKEDEYLSNDKDKESVIKLVTKLRHIAWRAPIKRSLSNPVVKTKWESLPKGRKTWTYRHKYMDRQTLIKR
jgi:hypothetical protein